MLQGFRFEKPRSVPVARELLDGSLCVANGELSLQGVFDSLICLVYFRFSEISCPTLHLLICLVKFPICFYRDSDKTIAPGRVCPV